jgi:hypothetical protein
VPISVTGKAANRKYQQESQKTNDPAQVDKLFRRQRRRVDLAIICGPKSGVFGIEFDKAQPRWPSWPRSMGRSRRRGRR